MVKDLLLARYVLFGAVACASPVLSGCASVVAQRLYTEEEREYFEEIAFGSEVGVSSRVIRKWTKDLRIDVHGSPTSEDEATLNAVVSEINQLIEPVQLVISSEESNVDLYFIPLDEFEIVEPNYVPGNLGFFYPNWNSLCEILHANVLISTEEVTQTERSHLIREELTQSLGLMRDSHRYPESIFYQEWTDVTSYAEIDKTVIEMLYRFEVQTCMNKEETGRVLQNLEN